MSRDADTIHYRRALRGRRAARRLEGRGDQPMADGASGDRMGARQRQVRRSRSSSARCAGFAQLHVAAQLTPRLIAFRPTHRNGMRRGCTFIPGRVRAGAPRARWPRVPMSPLLRRMHPRWLLQCWQRGRRRQRRASGRRDHVSPEPRAWRLVARIQTGAAALACAGSIDALPAHALLRPCTQAKTLDFVTKFLCNVTTFSRGRGAFSAEIGTGRRHIT